MNQQHPRSRVVTCLFLFFLLACILFVSIILVPQLISIRAEQLYGPPTSQLSTAQRLYLSTLLILRSKDLIQPIDIIGSDKSITIERGESVPSIIDQLWEAGLISDPGLFRNYLQYSGLDTQLQAGEYQFSPAMTAIDIVKEMQISNSPYVTLTILPGWRVEEIANSLPSTGLNLTSEEFLQTVNQQPEGYSFTDCLGENNLEGFLYPSSYVFLREASVNEVLSRVLMDFEVNVTSEMRNGFNSQGLDLCQAVTLASIVEREAMQDDEMPLIASVFYNRLNAGSVLASDPTVQYALGYNQDQHTWWTNPLTFQDLKVDSPYNSYIYSGLPPGPISNPGQAALEAVAFPTQTPYFYFRAACDGSGNHLFAETFEEHVANECP
jgi:UPF0755 protein